MPPKPIPWGQSQEEEVLRGTRNPLTKFSRGLFSMSLLLSCWRTQHTVGELAEGAILHFVAWDALCISFCLQEEADAGLVLQA